MGMKVKLNSLRDKFFRLKKHGDCGLDTQLRRCLSTFDIALLGVGHMIGAGIYVITGASVRDIAGPAIVLSFLFAGVAAFLSALCYAEFGARFPKAGSAYTYTYVGVGELWAFVIGWNIILEHMLSAAGYLDSLLGNVISNTTKTRVLNFEDTSFFGDYPDMVAFILVCIVAVFIAIGSKASTNFNSAFTILNLCVITFVVSYGMTFANFGLWSGTVDMDGETKSRFWPYGFNGMLAGAAACFFAYVGFDGLATAGEEASNPGKSIPLATFISMAIVTAAYVLMSSTLTLMVPFEKVHPSAAFSDAFATKGTTWARYVVSVGALCGMITSLAGSMFALPRCVYAMADDGLLFRCLAVVHSKTQVPLNAVIVFSCMTAILALLFDISTLVEFLSIGTLLAYTIVSICVVVLRYQPHPRVEDGTPDKGGALRTWCPMYSTLSAYPQGVTVVWGLTAMTIAFFIVGLSFSTGLIASVFGYIMLFIGVVLSIASLVFINAHYQTSAEVAFRVPFVPWLPAVSVFVNILMMLHLAPITWLRLAVWMVIGMAIYLLYGIRHSKEEMREERSAIGDMTKSTTYESVVSDSIQ